MREAEAPEPPAAPAVMPAEVTETPAAPATMPAAKAAVLKFKEVRPATNECPICTGKLSHVSCPINHRAHFWKSLGPTALACPHCRELLKAGQCPQCAYHLDQTVAENRAQWLEDYREAVRRTEETRPAVWGVYAGAGAFLGIGYFLFAGALAALAFPYKFYRNKDFSERMTGHWWVWGWALKLGLLALLLSLILHGVNRIFNASLFSKAKQIKRDLLSLPPAPIELYTTPLTLERLGPPEKVQAANLMQNSPRSQTVPFQATHGMAAAPNDRP